MVRGSYSTPGHRIAIVASALATASAAGSARGDPFVLSDSFENGLSWSKFEEAVVGNACAATTVGDVSVVPLGGPGDGLGLRVFANAAGSLKASHVIAQKRLLDVGPYGVWTLSAWVRVDAEAIVDTQTGPEFSLQNTRPIGLEGDAQQWRTLTAGVQYIGSQYDSNQGWRVWGIAGPGLIADSETAAWINLDEPLRLDVSGWYELTLSVDYDALTYDTLTVRHENDAEPTVVLLDAVEDGQPVPRRIAREDKQFSEAALWATLEAESLYDCDEQTSFQHSAWQNAAIYDDVQIEQIVGVVHAAPEAEDRLLDGHTGDTFVFELEDLAFDPDGDLDPSTLRVVIAPEYGTFEVDPVLGTLTYAASEPGGGGLKYAVCDATYLCTEAWIYGGWGVSLSGSEAWIGLNGSNEALPDLRFGDFDGNGETDVFHADGSEWWVSWSGSGSWSHLNTSGYTVGSLAFVDFDGDGETDVFRANGSKWWVSWSGSGPWSELNTASDTLPNLRFADFNNDDRADVFRADGTTWWVSWSGTGLWSPINTSAYTVGSLAFADFDGDGKSEVFRTGGSKWWVSWSGTGMWSQLNSVSDPLSSLRFGDFDGDGESDVLRADGSKWWVSWSGTGAWSQLNTSGHSIEHLAVHDFDGDGASDVFRAWY